MGLFVNFSYSANDNRNGNKRKLDYATETQRTRRKIRKALSSKTRPIQPSIFGKVRTWKAGRTVEKRDTLLEDLLLDKITTANKENAVLVGIALPETNSWIVEEHLDELEQLALTAGAKIVGRVMQERSRIDPRHFLGKGKIEEIAIFVEDNEIGVVIFDDDLSPAQLRNIENKVKTKIIDRSALILDIFASHARTREAKTQVELAQLQYLLPRLTRQWTHLSRQVGGIGTKGPGETQLETDRRLVRTRIQRLKGDLEKIERQRAVRRKGRDNFFKVALVGYTNVGKSTIMNILSNADVLVQNQLFATLDSTIRKVHLDYGKEILLSDTVGFIRKLPHNLVASFRSTLEEAREAD
ncbi:MAG: GTPase HflX, partial [Calditrichia bacterium]|nr:GTPase HflX [Calditrichia bacterium]